MNNVSIIGNITADPKLKPVGSTQVCEFSIACNEVFYIGEGQHREKKEVVHYFDVQCWGARGEALAKFFTKGKPIAITGTLKQDRWEKEGEKRSKVYIRVESWDFAGGDRKEGEPKDWDDAKAQAEKREGAQKAPAQVDEDNIPL